MTVNKDEQKDASPEPQDLLMQFNELTSDLQVIDTLTFCIQIRYTL
jgi:hypothetical protein